MKYCAVPTCGNSSYINYRHKANRCSAHGCDYGTGPCKCEPPLQFFPFPTKKDMEGRERWTKLINRKYPNGESWQPDPSGRSTVCSVHFPDGQPTKRNPDPILKLGYEPPAELIRKPQPTPTKKKKTQSELKPDRRWSAPLLTGKPQALLSHPNASNPHHPVTKMGKTMTAIIQQTKTKPRPPKRQCIACQNILESGQHVSSNRGQLDLQECLRQHFNLEVEHGWMCINCVRQVKTVVKKVNMFRNRVLAGQCTRVYDVSHVGEENEAMTVERQSDPSRQDQTLASLCQCSRLLTSMLSKQNVSQPMEKTKIRVIFPKPTGANATDPCSESSDDLLDSSASEEEDDSVQPRNKKRRMVTSTRKEVVVQTMEQPGSVAENCQQLPTTNQHEHCFEVPTTSSNTVQPAQLQVIFPGQGLSVSNLLFAATTVPGSVHATPIILNAQPTVSDSSTPTCIPGLHEATLASDEQTDFVYTKTLNELAKQVAMKPSKEHDYALF